MTAWPDLVATALIGTDHQAWAPPEDRSKLATILQRLDGSDQAAALLSQAAAVSLFLRAGATPPLNTDRPFPPAPEDDLPVCSRRSEHTLAAMLGGRYVEALPEWLEAVARAGRRVAPSLLPELLDAGEKKHALQELIQPVLGKRGQWLANLQPAWDHYAADADVDWETSRFPGRLALFKRLRHSDPAQARALLETAWSSEPWEVRKRMLESMETNLTMDDETFLETCLDDRRRTVAEVAAMLLSLLPESRLVARMIERLAPLIRPRWELPGRSLGPLGKGRTTLYLDIALPASCTRDMTRDGIAEKRSGSAEVGARTSWLMSMVTAVPPAHWARHADVSPAIFAEAAADERRAGENSPLLLEALGAATLRHRDAAWARALIPWRERFPGTGGMLTGQGTSINHTVQRLFSILPPDERDEIGAQVAAETTNPAEETFLPMHLFRDCDGLRFARTTLDLVRRHIAAGTYDKDWRLHAWLQESALSVPTALVDEASRTLTAALPEGSTWAATVNAYLSLLQFRHDMLEEIIP